MIEGILEIGMLLCFAVAWPFSIYKLWKSKENGGKSVIFSFIVILGYLFGIGNKFVMNEVNYVLAFYFLDLCLVIIDTALYYRNGILMKRNAC